MGGGRHGDPPMAWIRLLEETKGETFGTLSSPGFIVWYCFVGICVVVACVCCCWHFGGRSRRQQYQLDRMVVRNEREESQQAERRIEITRIEANIQAFSDQQMIRRRKALVRTLNGQRVTVTKQHLALSANSSPEEETSETVEGDSQHDFASGCSICLEGFVEGTRVMNSVDRMKCRHLFHEDCILTWLMSESDPQCPCCRQPFTDHNLSYETPPTSQSNSNGGSTGAFFDPRPDVESRND